MGAEARANPRSADGGTPLTDVYLARLERFAASFATRADLDAYLASTHFTADEAATLERLLPARLKRD